MFETSRLLARLSSATRVSIDGRLGERLDPDAELRGLDLRLRELRERRSIGEGRPPQSVDIDALWERWRDVRPDTKVFNKRELRALCWDQRAASDPAFVEALALSQKLPLNNRLLRGLWHAHQQRFRMETSARIEQLARISGQISGYKPRWLRVSVGNPGILSSGAPTALAQYIGGDWEHAGERLDGVGISTTGSLGKLALEQLRSRWMESVVRYRDEKIADKILAAGREGLLKPALVDFATYRTTVERLLEIVKGSSGQYRSLITSLILTDERLGHPMRVRTRGNWTGFSEQAKRWAVQLFAARDLAAFFEILMTTRADTQHRRQFWERYVESPQLVEFAIACDTEDRRRLISMREREFGDVASLRNTTGPETMSAFMMRFRGTDDVVVVEMSKPNHAMYLYRTHDFEQHFGHLDGRSFDFGRLKDRAIMIDRFVHRENWHDRFELVLRAYRIQRRAG